jgi:hypothetical protein
MFLKNIGICLQDYMVSERRSPQMFTAMRASKLVYKSSCFMKIMVFGDVTPCRSVDRYQCFGEDNYISYTEYVGGRFL